MLWRYLKKSSLHKNRDIPPSYIINEEKLEADTAYSLPPFVQIYGNNIFVFTAIFIIYIHIYIPFQQEYIVVS